MTRPTSIRAGLVIWALFTALGCASYTSEFRAFIAPFEYEDAARAHPPASSCPIHNVPTVRALVESKAGLLVQPNHQRRRYLHAKSRHFLYSYWSVYSGSCELGGYLELPVCPACRSAERLWRTQHGMPSVEPIPLDEYLPTATHPSAASRARVAGARLTPACSGLATLAADARR